MGNIYGVANPYPLAATYATVGGVDVACPADTETTVITTGALVAPSPGFWYPVVFVFGRWLSGATKPNTLTIAFKLGAGADVASYVVDPAALVNAGRTAIVCSLVGLASATAWVKNGSTLNITALAAAQAGTFLNAGSQALVLLLRGPDA